MQATRIIRVSSSEEMRLALEVRRRVFIEEQGVPESLEIDEHDGDPRTVTTAWHVVVLEGDLAVATGRLLLAHEDGRAHIGRVAVLKEHRRSGHGRTVMQALHALALEQGIRDITLAAQLHAIGFYERLGYTLRAAEVFLDADIEHRWMDLRLEDA